ncbi:hypothetical protein BYT27DRAFT_6958507 [Phlegmacium glaucopus]|nr:hypothetical protein BYT27DRAFT_6958507 [Phlegmacium glaucopus]
MDGMGSAVLCTIAIDVEVAGSELELRASVMFRDGYFGFLYLPNFLKMRSMVLDAQRARWVMGGKNKDALDYISASFVYSGPIYYPGPKCYSGLPYVSKSSQSSRLACIVLAPELYLRSPPVRWLFSLVGFSNFLCYLNRSSKLNKVKLLIALIIIEWT